MSSGGHPFDDAPVAMVVAADELVLYANRAAARLLTGRSTDPDDIAGMPLRLRNADERASSRHVSLDDEPRTVQAALDRGDWITVSASASPTVWHGHSAAVIAFTREMRSARDPHAVEDSALSHVVQESDTAYYLIDIDSGRYVHVNDAAVKQTGRTREALTALTADDVEPAAGPGQKTWRERQQALVKTAPRATTQEEWLDRPDGGKILVQTTRMAVRRDGRWLLAMLRRDISDVHLAHQQATRFRAAVDAAGEMITLIDPDTARYLDVNEAACKLLGYSREQLLGMAAYEVDNTHNTPQAMLRACREVLAAYPRTGRYRVELRSSTGEVIPMEFTRTALNTDGRWSIVTAGRDIREREANQRALQRFRAAVDQAAEAIVLTDRRTMRFVDVNETACRLHGLTRGQLLASAPHQIDTRQRSRAELEAEFDRVIAMHPDHFTRQETVTRSDAVSVEVETTLRALRSGSDWLIVASSRDLTERLHAQRTQANFRLALDQTKDAISLVDRESMRFVDVNQTAADSAGVSREEYLEMAPWATLDGVQGHQLAAFYDHVIAKSPSPVYNRATYRRPDGTRYPADSWISATRVGQRWLLVVSTRDVSEQVLAESRANLLAATVNASSIATFVVDVQSLRNIEVNQAACELFGLSRETLLSGDASGENPGQDHAQTAQAKYEAVCAMHPRTQVEVSEVARPDGTRVPVEIRRHALRHEDRWLVTVTMADVSERVGAQRQVERFRIALDSSTEALILTDPERVEYLDFNEAACRLYGRSRQEMLRLGPAGTAPFILHEDTGEVQDPRAMLRALMQSPGRAVTRDITITRPDGTRSLVEATRVAVRQGDQWMVLSTLRDVTVQRATRRQLERFRAAIDQASDGIVLIDAQSLEFVDVNDTLCRIFEATREEILAEGPVGLGRRPPAATDLDENTLRRAYEGLIAQSPQPAIHVASGPGPDGRHRELEFTRAAHQIDGRWLIVSTIRDVTVSRAAQQALERFRLAMDNASDGIALVDAHTLNYIDLNQTACRMFGCTREEAIALGPIELARQAGASADFDEARLRESYGELIRTRQPHVAILSLRDARGEESIREIRRSIHPVGERLVVVAVFRDVTREHQTRRQLERFRAAIEKAGDAIILVDPDRRAYIDINEAACRLYGLSREEMMRIGPDEVVRRVYRHSERDLERVRQGRELLRLDPTRTITVELEIVRPDGSTVIAQASRVALIDGEQRAILSTIRDITQQWSTQQQLERFRVALDQTDDALTLLDRELLRFVDVNAQALNRSGLSREEYLAIRPWERRVGMTREALEKLLDEAIAAAPRATKSEELLSLPDGSSYFAEVTRNAVRIDGRWFIVAATRDITERRLAQQRNDMLVRLTNMSPDALFVSDRALNRFIYANEAACRMLDMPLERLLQRDPTEPDGPYRDRQQIIDETEAAIAISPRAHSRVFSFRRNSNGEPMSIAISRQALREDDRWIIITQIRDVTESHQTQRRLERFKAALDKAGDAITLVDIDKASFIEVNEAACRLFGLSREDMMTLGPYGVIRKVYRDGERVLEHLLGTREQRQAQPGAGMTFDIQIVRPDGTERLAEATRVALVEDGARVTLSTIRDVTAQRAAQAEMARFRHALDQASDAIMLVNADTGGYIDVNAATCRLFGMSREEILASHWHQVARRVYQDPDREIERAKVNWPILMATPGKELVNDVELQGTDGTARIAEVTRVAYNEASQWVVLSIFRDVTVQRKAQEELRRFRTALDQSGDAVMLIDPKAMRYIDVNATACRMVGMSRDELLASSPLALSTRHANEAELAAMYDGIIAMYPKTVTAPGGFRRKDGSMQLIDATRGAFRSGSDWLIVVTARDVAEREAARQALERFRAAIDQSTDAIVLTDPETAQYIDVNETLCKWAGRSREEVLRMGPAQLPASLGFSNFPDEDAIRQAYRRALAQPDRAFTEVIHARRPDSSAWILEYVRIARQIDGRWIIIATIRDITDSWQARARNERLAAIVNLSADAMFVTDMETARWIEINDAAALMYGATREQMLTMRLWREGTRYPDEASIRRLFDQLIQQSPTPLIEETESMRADGSRFFTEIQRQAVQVDGRWLMLATVRDITERRQARRRLEQFRAAMDQSVDALTLIDRESMRFLDVNIVAARRAGVTVEEYLRLPPWQRVVGVTREDMERDYDQVIAAAPRPVVTERRLRLPDGGAYDAEISRTAMKFDDSWIIVSSTRDVTQRKRAEAEIRRRVDELTRSNQELERFAYVASHDLSEPLRMVASYTQLLERRYKDRLDDDGREFMGFVIDGAQRMKTLIDDLLTYSRAGRVTRPPRAVDMNAVMDEVRSNLAALAVEKAAQIRSAALPTVLADRTSIIQLLQNLVANGLKFCKREPAIVTVSAREEPDAWVFSVSDNGIGIESRYFERIFLLFQRLHGRGEYQGTGIGLSICRKLVEMHGGKIWVESTPGEGSTFHFSLMKTPPGVDPAAG